MFKKTSVKEKNYTFIKKQLYKSKEIKYLEALKEYGKLGSVLTEKAQLYEKKL